VDYLSPAKKAKYLAFEEHKRQQELNFSSRNNTIVCEVKSANLCKPKYNLTITTPESAQINSVFEINDKYEATELTPKNNIVNFEVSNMTVNYFPRGLEKIFINLQHFSVEKCQLKEVHQSDLKSYTELNSISLTGNLIEVIEEHLFDFNTKLIQIYLSYNPIVYVSTDAFSKLPLLQTLHFFGIPCLDHSFIKGCTDAYGLPLVFDNLRRHCNSNHLDSDIKSSA
jgi:hypothetical protein